MNPTKHIKKEHIKIIMFSMLMIAPSCQKVIDLDLNSADPQLVVEANISDQPGPYFVKLSKTVNFTKINEIPPVSGATVVIADSTGNSDTLIEKKPGIYITKSLKGIPGQTYTLSIATEGKTYKAISHMPYPVDIQKLNIVLEKEDRPSYGQRDTNNQKAGYQVNYEIADPVQYNNYYRFVTYYKNRELNSRRVFDDKFHNGKIIADEFGLHDSIKFKPGDTLLVKLLNIDKATYNFFRTIRDGAGGLGFLSASPANPITNLSGNALGYFSAYAEKYQIIVIPF